VRSIEIKSNPTADSYEGLPVELKGLEVWVRYDDDPLKAVTVSPGGKYNFYTEPAIAVGVRGINTGTSSYEWAAMRSYTLLMDTGEGRLERAEITVPAVHPIARAESWTTVDDTVGFVYQTGKGSSDYYWDRGLRLVGDLGQEVYVDQYPDLNKYRLQAEYDDGMQEFKMRPDMVWEMRPRYNNGYDDTGMGDLWITIGANPFAAAPYSSGGFQHKYVKDALDEAGLAWPTDNKADPGLTTSHTYTKMFHVLKLEATSNTELQDYFYWEDDTQDEWISRLKAAGTTLKVHYTNNTTKDFSVEYALAMNDVWRNYVEGWTSVYTPFGVKGIQESTAATAERPNGLTHSQNNKAANPPHITLNYRGALARIDVPIFTRPSGLSVTPKKGEPPIDVDMRWDDNDRGQMTALAFSRLIDVVATFTAQVPFADRTATLTLTFDDRGTTDADSGQAGAVDEPTQYSMNFGKADDWIANDWSGGWGQAATVGNNGKARDVTVYYATPVEIAGTAETAYTHGFTTSRKVNQKISVSWSNIHVKK